MKHQFQICFSDWCLKLRRQARRRHREQGAQIPMDGAGACCCLPCGDQGRSSKLKIASKWAQFDCFNASRENTGNVEILK